MKEARLQKKIIAWLIDNEICCWKTNPQHARGLPDIVGCLNGRFIAIEVKSDKGRISKLQAYMHARIAEAGGKVLVARNLGEVKKYIGDMEHGGNTRDTKRKYCIGNVGDRQAT